LRQAVVSDERLLDEGKLLARQDGELEGPLGL
jgi:hypothetical protein